MTENKDLYDINIVRGSYIRFTHKDAYVIEGNECGFKSLIRVLNKLLKKEYDFVRLCGMQFNDTYTNHPDCFFDNDSISLEIEKKNGRDNQVCFKKYFDLLQKENIHLILTRKSIILMKNQILDLINDKKIDSINLYVYDLEEKNNKKIIITRQNFSPIRKY